MKASCGKVGTAFPPKRYGNKQLRARSPPDGAQRALAQHFRYDTAQIPGRQNACDWRTFRMEQLAVYSDIDWMRGCKMCLEIHGYPCANIRA
jgi:hypothetical protein